MTADVLPFPRRYARPPADRTAEPFETLRQAIALETQASLDLAACIVERVQRLRRMEAALAAAIHGAPNPPGAA